jgi:transmembrane sensor
VWLVHFDAGRPVAAGSFEAWLEASPENVEAWAAANAGWATFDRIEDLADGPLNDLRARALEDGVTRSHSVLRSFWWPLAAAASLALVAYGALQIETSGDHPGVSRADFSSEYASAGSKPRVIRLPDGSAIALGAGAGMKVTFDRAGRAIRLERGRAQFAVAHERNRPFRVVAGELTITALGTRFEVDRASDGTLRVSLFEGRVGITGRGADILLSPGQQVLSRPRQGLSLATAGGKAIGKPSADFVQLDDVTLAEAAERMNQGSRVRLVINEPRVARLRVSGRFESHNVERFARTVSDFLPVRVVRRNASTIELRGVR